MKHPFGLITTYIAVFITVLGTVGSLFTACSAKEKPSSEMPKPAADWSVKMQELSKALNRLLPLVVSSKAFNDPANKIAIEDETDQLKKLSHQVLRLEKPSADPAYDSIAKMLDEDLTRAGVALRSGNRDYARITIRESIGYCIQCHTQAASGPSFPKLDLGFNPAGMTALGQGDYYAATRQFDSALTAYRSGVHDPNYATKDIFGWERAVRAGLSIAVRFKQSPASAKSFAQEVIKNRAAPDSLRMNAQSWIKDLNQWAREKQNLYKGENAKLERAEALISQAAKLITEDSTSNQDIRYLRASADLHQWLSEHPLKTGENEALRARALYLAGQAAEETRDLNFWTLHERYYELCIDTKPKSDIAKNCFKKLNDSVLLGYTGSGGQHLPPEESQRLARLKEKSGG